MSRFVRTGPAATLEPFVPRRTVLLTTYRRDRTPVGTPVHIAVDGDRAFVRTYDKAWKLKRIRNNPAVEVAPATTRGVPTGPAIHARARLLDGDEAVRAVASSPDPARPRDPDVPPPASL